MLAVPTGHVIIQITTFYDGVDEIDVVALAPDDDRILLAECKWTSEPVGHALVDDLLSPDGTGA